MTNQRINPMTVGCPYCGVHAARECIRKGSQEPANSWRGIRLAPGHYHPARVEAARALTLEPAS